MKNAYPESPIIMATTFMQACYLYINSHENPVTQGKTWLLTIYPSIINNYNTVAAVGIKFDIMTTRNYFVLIHSSLQNVIVYKAIGKYDNILLPLPAENSYMANREQSVVY